MSNLSSSPPTKRSTFTGSVNTQLLWPNLESTSSSSISSPMWTEDSVEAKMKSFQQNRRAAVVNKGNLWSSQIQEEKEQELMDEFQVVAVEETLVIHRGSETYHVRNTKGTRKRKNMSSDSGEEGKTEIVTKEGQTDYDSDHSAFSDTGLAPDDLDHIRKVDCEKAHLAAKVEGAQPQLQKKSLSRIDNILKNIKDHNLHKFIAKQLREKKHYLIGRCVEKLGREYCVRVFRKTVKIECKGGLMTKDQKRRRTPGGVFFYIIRMDPKNAAEVLNEIFEPAGTGNQKVQAKPVSIFEKMSKRSQGNNANGKPSMKPKSVMSMEVDSDSYRVPASNLPQNQLLDPRAKKTPLVTYDDLF